MNILKIVLTLLGLVTLMAACADGGDKRDALVDAVLALLSARTAGK